MTLMGAQTQGNDVAFITGPTNFANGQMMKIVDLVLQGNMEKAKVGEILKRVIEISRQPCTFKNLEFFA